MRRLFLVAVVTAGCTTGPGRGHDGLDSLAHAACRHAKACGCSPIFPPECEGDIASMWPDAESATFALSEGQSAVFDPQCLDTLVDLVEAADCDTDFRRFWSEAPCAVFHGTRGLGDACEDVPPSVSDCLPGLHCVAGQCEQLHVADPTALKPLPGELCDEAQTCDETAWCDTGVGPPDGPVCRPRVAEGGPCTGHDECLTVYCPRGTCARRPTEGRPCGAQMLCADGLTCVDEVCTGGAALCVPPSVFQ